MVVMQQMRLLTLHRHLSQLLFLLTMPMLEWYLERFGVQLDRNMVLPVLYALQGHPESGNLWEDYINKILPLSELHFQSTMDDRTIVRSTLARLRENASYFCDKLTTLLWHVDATSTVPQLVPWSTCEAEYCVGALAKMEAFYVRKVQNEIHRIDPDYQLTIPIGIDSQSATDTAISHKETQRTRHFQRRFHFIRLLSNYLFKVDDTANCSNCLIKPLPAEQFATEIYLFEVDVDP
jgi:hypothetical protein